jgi:hypothetical protein
MFLILELDSKLTGWTGAPKEVPGLTTSDFNVQVILGSQASHPISEAMAVRPDLH